MSEQPDGSPVYVPDRAMATRRNPVWRALCRLVLRLAGWRIEGTLPPQPKYVAVGAPHTSNWDWALLIFASGVLGFKPYWMGKKELFPRPFDGLMRWLGGIPIDRSAPRGLVEQVADAFRAHDEFVVVITPEATRARGSRWKSGFYRIAEAAGVPILLIYVNYPARRIVLGPTLDPSGDLEADLRRIHDYYSDKLHLGRFPDQGTPVLAEEETN